MKVRVRRGRVPDAAWASISTTMSEAVLSLAPGVLYWVSAWAKTRTSSSVSPGRVPTTLQVRAPGTNSALKCRRARAPSLAACSRKGTSCLPTHTLGMAADSWSGGMTPVTARP